MADVINVYVSAAPVMAPEREVMGRIITEIPTSLAWRIVQTPPAGDEPNLSDVSNTDVHFLIIGEDIRAPIGVEWIAAKRAGHLPYLLLKNVAMRTQAANAFLSELARYGNWHRFSDNDELRILALTMLSDYILSHQDNFDIGKKEASVLLKWQASLKKASKHMETIRGGAGDSSVIFSAERYVPSSGVLLQPPEQSTGMDSSVTTHKRIIQSSD